ncbi:putative ankyrin repeat protein [Trypanosoma cruzi]|uniref:Ankyrin repeat protein, putative n=3 Tax=Trypanosoma cruzi TaxID=5693 RepID=Q4D7R0_TRYCC|nr:ankyrin repeat protein, putative [Trypanosoma cruzi]XP_821357.1 ankyrin repeat protein, putative [Trypanosoma cruzi]ESS67560.1 ankyrin repeat protein [Trypanosoma cruzi Dm28c]PBJ80518.1 ankyrin repeat protein [Trypanosoma cruzi cruzi]EAN88557.1 ankyrin repeat protein, putative [Trypanosoma cruzi]EAN99506.1 ankyrin repeat protein, putative [Trypanosoma cruzi]KAF8277781.1 putative ankyrin repeat protein [Trypanosoma cruzi]|eukprot:XP_810408.1 ankyrin repeat protein [Trypanosoma cruzi strain CL Brener]
MPYPYILQCRESSPEDVIVKYDVAATTGGDLTSVFSLTSKPGNHNIFVAACDGDVPALRMFLGLGVDINEMGQPNPQYGPQFDRRTLFRAPPLCYAAGYGREKAVAALLEDGADALKTSSTGFKAVDYARHRGYTAIVQMLESAEERKRSDQQEGKE